MRQQHRAGEKLFVDWAGAKIPISNPESGETQLASLFVAVMGASSYTYAEATASQALEPWIGAHVRTFEFLGGVPEIVVPDNAKTGVLKACRYEPDLNPTYQEMAMYYGIGVVPARPRKPRDVYRLPSAGSWLHCGIANSSHWSNSITRSPSCWRNSTSVLLESARAAGKVYSTKWTNRHCARCRLNPTISRLGQSRGEYRLPRAVR
jgi:hypothetical protein